MVKEEVSVVATPRISLSLLLPPHRPTITRTKRNSPAGTAQVSFEPEFDTETTQRKHSSIPLDDPIIRCPPESDVGQRAFRQVQKHFSLLPFRLGIFFLVRRRLNEVA